MIGSFLVHIGSDTEQTKRIFSVPAHFRCAPDDREPSPPLVLKCPTCGAPVSIDTHDGIQEGTVHLCLNDHECTLGWNDDTTFLTKREDGNYEG